MRTDHPRFRRWSVIAGAALLLIVMSSALCPPVLLYNHTPSVPVGFYVWCGQVPQRGDLVAFSLPMAAHPYAQARADSPDVLLLKPVLAVAGDHVSTLNNELRINGTFVGIIANADSAGRTLPHWRAARTLRDGELFVGSTRTTHSFDSRFFGPVHASQVVGVYRPLWLHSSSSSANLSLAAASQRSPHCNGIAAARH